MMADLGDYLLPEGYVDPGALFPGPSLNTAANEPPATVGDAFGLHPTPLVPVHTGGPPQVEFAQPSVSASINFTNHGLTEVQDMLVATSSPDRSSDCSNRNSDAAAEVSSSKCVCTLAQLPEGALRIRLGVPGTLFVSKQGCMSSAYLSVDKRLALSMNDARTAVMQDLPRAFILYFGCFS
jgi:hypothetical protein